MIPLVLNNIYENEIKKTMPDDFHFNFKTKNLKLPHMCWKYLPYAKNKNDMINVKCADNYFDQSVKLSNLLDMAFIMSVNHTAWAIQAKGYPDKQVEYMSNCYYKLRDEYCNSHTEKENAQLAAYLD